MLKAELHKLRQKYPHAHIIYADYYAAAMRFYHAPGHYGQLIATLNSADLIKSLFFAHAEAWIDLLSVQLLKLNYGSILILM